MLKIVRNASNSYKHNNAVKTRYIQKFKNLSDKIDAMKKQNENNNKKIIKSNNNQSKLNKERRALYFGMMKALQKSQQNEINNLKLENLTRTTSNKPPQWWNKLVKKT